MTLNIVRQERPDLSRLSILLYGLPKVGKTTEAAKFPEPLILECEPGGAGFVLGVDKLTVTSLSELERTIGEILKQPHKTLILDGFTWMLEQAVKTSGERDPRQSYKLVGDRFITLMGTILNSNKIIIATGHSRKVDDDDVKGKVEIRPDVNPNLSDMVYGAFSIICYCYPTADGSKMLTKPDDNDKRRIVAGDRSGKLPKIMKLSALNLMSELKKNVLATPTVAQPQPTTPSESATK